MKEKCNFVNDLKKYLSSDKEIADHHEAMKKKFLSSKKPIRKDKPVTLFDPSTKAIVEKKRKGKAVLRISSKKTFTSTISNFNLALENDRLKKELAVSEEARRQEKAKRIESEEARRQEEAKRIEIQKRLDEAESLLKKHKIDFQPKKKSKKSK